MMSNWRNFRRFHSTFSLADVLIDNHAASKIAMKHEPAFPHHGPTTLTYGDFANQSNQLARFLKQNGFHKQDKVAGLLPKIPELATTALATWRSGGVYVPLFTAFGPEAIEHRVRQSGANVIVTDAHNRPKLDDLSADLRKTLKIITIPGSQNPSSDDGVQSGDFHFRKDAIGSGGRSEIPISRAAIGGRGVAPDLISEKYNENDLMVLLFTSGTTGQPKGVEIPAKSINAFKYYMQYGLHLQPNDHFWNIADCGWAYGLYYSLLGPLLLEQTTLWVDAHFTAELAYDMIKKHEITNLAGAPTAYRVLKAAGSDLIKKVFPNGTSPLRKMSSAGEPLNPEVIEFFKTNFGVSIHDHYGQTELGMMVNNHQHPDLAKPIKSGSMGHPMPGFRMAVLDSEGNERTDGEFGELAIDVNGSPLHWFQRYFKNEEKTKERFYTSPANGKLYSLTGDVARIDPEGYFFFQSRADDVITTSGYRVGPFEVESSLLHHPAVAESAVVGSPDPLRFEVVKAFVVLRQGYSPSDALANELQQLVKKNLSAHEYPREIEFLTALPKTQSGKLQRNLLKKQEYERKAQMVPTPAN